VNTDTPLISLRGKRALVTGGSRGIGAATVRLLARAGADVVVGYRKRSRDADAIVDEVRSTGVRAIAVAADVATQKDADRLVRAAINELGELDLFVANAGIWPVDDIALVKMTDAHWHRTINHNLDSVFFTTRAVARVMSDGGSIVLLSSTAGQRGEANHADYAATKGAIISLTKSLAVELASRDIRVNCVAPGWVDTEMVEDAIAATGIHRIASGIPLGRIASPEDVAGPIVFLCSALARHITGEVLNVNGGSVLCG
jgi:3-oxoacyl-[acyl-carrier protein] reductase